MTRHPLDSFANPASVAVIGASTVLHKAGGRRWRSMVDARFPGPLYPIHPTAREIGLVSRVVGPKVLLSTAEQIAERISQNGPLAIKLTKELAWRSLHQHPDDALRFYGAVTALIHQTEDSKEGPRAFAEKRTPRFKGK